MGAATGSPGPAGPLSGPRRAGRGDRAEQPRFRLLRVRVAAAASPGEPQSHGPGPAWAESVTEFKCHGLGVQVRHARTVTAPTVRPRPGLPVGRPQCHAAASARSPPERRLARAAHCHADHHQESRSSEAECWDLSHCDSDSGLRRAQRRAGRSLGPVTVTTCQ